MINDSQRTTGMTAGIVIAFVCQLCGECCGSMGEIIVIRERNRDGTLRIGFMPTGEERSVSLDPEKQDLFDKTAPVSGLACPFLREQSPGRAICTVHSSRPELCRQYGCFRILILDSNGRRLGRVMGGTRYFISRDPKISAFWQQECRHLNITDEQAWEEEVDRLLSLEGYRIVRCDAGAGFRCRNYSSISDITNGNIKTNFSGVLTATFQY